MVMSDRPSFALLFEVRVESCRSCCNSFGASGDGQGQGRGRNWRTVFTFHTSSFELHVLANLVRDCWIKTLFLGHLLLHFCPR